MWIERLRSITKKISCVNTRDFVQQLNQIAKEGQLVSVKPTTPDATDTKMWYEVFYYINDF